MNLISVGLLADLWHLMPNAACVCSFSGITRPRPAHQALNPPGCDMWRRLFEMMLIRAVSVLRLNPLCSLDVYRPRVTRLDSWRMCLYANVSVSENNVLSPSMVICRCTVYLDICHFDTLIQRQRKSCAIYAFVLILASNKRSLFWSQTPVFGLVSSLQFSLFSKAQWSKIYRM